MGYLSIVCSSSSPKKMSIEYQIDFFQSVKGNLLCWVFDYCLHRWGFVSCLRYFNNPRERGVN